MIVRPSLSRFPAHRRRLALAGLLLALPLPGLEHGAAARPPGHVAGERPSFAAGWAGLRLQATEAVPAPAPGISANLGPAPRATQALAGTGTRVVGTLPLSPADRAGLWPGDLIVQLDGEPVAVPENVLDAIGARRPGETVSLTIQRGDRSLPVGLHLGVAAGPLLAPLALVAWTVWEPPTGHEPRPYLGVQVIELSAGLAPYFRTKPREGVLVTHVEPNGPAERGGLQAGDVIRSYAGCKVRSPADLRQALTDFGSGRHEVRIVRRGKRRTLRLRLEEPLADAELPDVGIFISRRDLELLRGALSRGDPEAHRELARLRAETEAVRATLRALEQDARAGAGELP